MATSASVTLSLRQRDTRFFNGGDHTNLDSRRGTMPQTTPVTFLPFSLVHHVGFTLLLSWDLMSSDVIGQHRERSLILICSGVVVLVLISTARWFTGRADFASSPALIEEPSELNPFHTTLLCSSPITRSTVVTRETWHSLPMASTARFSLNCTARWSRGWELKSLKRRDLFTLRFWSILLRHCRPVDTGGWRTVAGGCHAPLLFLRPLLHTSDL